MTILEELINYSNDILDGTINACQKHKWACERFLNDLDRIGTENFPYVWDEEKAQRIVDWFTFLKHTRGVLTRQSIHLTTFQKFSVCQVFGWVHKDTGLRRFRKVYKQVGRKNAKSQELSGVGLYMLMADGEDGAEIYCTATKRDQAKIVFNESRNMALKSSFIQKRLKINRDSLEHEKSVSIMKALSKEDQKKGDGYNPYLAIIDEYHSHETSEMYDIMDSGMGARKQPLIYVITTAGFNLNNPCYRVEYNYCSKLLDPNIDVENDEYFAIICELEKEDDIKDESNWIKANPILATYKEGINYLRGQLRIALEEPEKMRNFMTKNMNVWVDQKENGYMDMAKWKACGVDELPDLTGRECFVGIDLSSKIDLTSVGFEFRLDDGRYVVLSHSFMPEETLAVRRRTDKVPYDLWVTQGWITVTDGAVVDYRYVKKYIIDQIAQNSWTVKELCFDPYNATQFSQEMDDEGLNPVEIRQGIKTLSEPTKNFRELTYQKRILHNNNPVLTWAISNAVVRQDHNSNIMLDKDKSTQKIDPIAALINAHVRAMVQPEKPQKSVYEERGIITV